MTDHLDEASTAGLAALGADDPERRAAEAHASQCEACRLRWQSAEQMLALLDDGADFEPPHDLDVRAAGIVARAEAAARAARTRWHAALGALLVAAVVCVLGRLAGFEALASAVTQPALKCAAFVLAGGVLGTTSAILLARRAARAAESHEAAVLAAAGAVAAEVYLHFRCPAHEGLHLWLAHAATVAIAAILAAWLAPRVAPRRA